MAEEEQVEGIEYSYELGNYSMQRVGLDGVLLSPEKEAQWNDIAEYQSALQESLESGKGIDSSTIAAGAKIRFADGTVTAPSAAWNRTSWDTGLYFKKNETVTPTPTSSILEFSDPDIQQYSSSLFSVFKAEDSSAPITDTKGSYDLVEIQAGSNTFESTGIKNFAIEGPASSGDSPVYYGSGAEYVATGDGLTISFWLYLTTDTSETMKWGIIDKDQILNQFRFSVTISTSSSFTIATRIQNRNVSTDVGTGSKTFTGQTLPGWYHFLYRQDSSNAGQWYVNGTEETDLGFSGDDAEYADSDDWGATQIVVLAIDASGFNTTPKWGGNIKLDELYFWRTRVNDDAVSALYNGGSGTFYNL